MTPSFPAGESALSWCVDSSASPKKVTTSLLSHHKTVIKRLFYAQLMR